MSVDEIAVSARACPFPHSACHQLLPADLASNTLKWFEEEAPWQLQVESFYEQYELNLDQANVPAHLSTLVSPELVDFLVRRMLLPLTRERLLLSEANAHKLTLGQTIKIHNDYIGAAETHRILVQLNRGWSDDMGGMLMLFSGSNVEDVARLIRPVHGSAVAFEISPTSFHAVSTIRSGERFTLVYTFKRAD